jgi:2-oxoisovalerate dehydrogenase E1 component alpha subunit
MTSVTNHLTHQSLGLHDEDVYEMYYKMALTRAMDSRFGLLNRQGKVLAYASCQGQEGVQVGSTYALAPEDWIALSYREHGVAITRGMAMRDIFTFGYHRDNDITTRGRQIPGHYGSQKLHILTGSSPVGTQVPHAVGSAWASYYLGLNEATIVYFGDGSTSTGDVHAGLNFAAVHKLPVVLVCQNNEWAISVPNTMQFAVHSLVERAAGYGIPGEQVDGSNALAVYDAAKRALDKAHAGGGPTFIEAKCKRLNSHTTDDDQRRYRSKEEIEADRAFDPLPKFRAYMESAGLWDAGRAKLVEEKVSAEIEDAQQYAENSPAPKPDQALTHVFAAAQGN